MESLAREKEYQSSRTNDERLYRTCERSEQVLQRVNDIASKDDALKENMRNLDFRMDTVEEKQTEMLELLRNLNNALSSVLDKMAVDTRMAECLNRASRETSQVSHVSKMKALPEESQRKEPNNDVKTYRKIDLSNFPQIHHDEQHLLVRERSKSHLSANIEEASTPGIRSRTTTIAGDTPSTSLAPPIRQNLMTYGSVISINKSSKIANIRSKPSFR